MIVLGTVIAWASPVSAQFGGPADPPRPPGAVGPRPPQGLAVPVRPQPVVPARPAIQSEELPPPGGDVPPRSSAALPSAQPQAAVPPQSPNGARPPRGGNPAPAAAMPDEVVTAPPTQRIANPTAMFSGLDKITGRITTFATTIGETVQFGALRVTARVCYSRPPTETPLTDGFVEVEEVTLQGEVRRIFTGWMFATSPGLHAVEHPIYDVWLTDCKGGTQTLAESQPAAPATTPPRQPTPRQSRQPAPQPPGAR
jgi:hypothetical protein